MTDLALMTHLGSRLCIAAVVIMLICAASGVKAGGFGSKAKRK
jgi:hypothetical protein